MAVIIAERVIRTPSVTIKLLGGVFINTSIIGIILVTILVPIILSLLSKLFPSDESIIYDINYLRRTYKKWDAATLILFFIFSGLLCFVWYEIISFFAERSFDTIKNSILLIKVEKAYWFIPALFLSIVTSIFPLSLVLKLLLKNQYKEYIAYSNSLYKADGLKIFKLISFIIVPICIVFIVLGMNWYTYFTTDKIINNNYFSFKESIHSYKDVKQIYKVEKFEAPNRNILEEPYYVILFSDDYLLNMRPKSISTKQFEDNILSFIIKNSGKNINNVEFIDNIK